MVGATGLTFERRNEMLWENVSMSWLHPTNFCNKHEVMSLEVRMRRLLQNSILSQRNYTLPNFMWERYCARRTRQQASSRGLDGACWTLVKQRLSKMKMSMKWSDIKSLARLSSDTFKHGKRHLKVISGCMKWPKQVIWQSELGYISMLLCQGR